MAAPTGAGRRDPAVATVSPTVGHRLHALDILRGFALLGMTLVHFHQKMRLEVSGLQDLIGWFVYVAVEQKAWGTFAFLFGAGFAVLLRRLEARQAPVVAFYLRRLAGLAVFGIVAEVCFGFQILLSYAIWGVPLLFLRKWSTRTLLLAAAGAAAARPLLAAATALYAWWTLGPEGAAAWAKGAGAAGQVLSDAVKAAEQQSNYLQLFWSRLALFRWNLVDWRTYLPDSNLALFIIGLLAVRHGVFDAPRRHLRLIGSWMAFGFASWAAAWLLLRGIPDLPVPGLAGTLRSGMGLVQDQWLCFSYMGALVLLLAYRPVWERRLAPIGRAGRMALTNYMLQVAILDYLAQGYGVGLKLRPLAYVGATALSFGVVVAWSSWWLARFRFGPFEWLWRTFTYLRPQPMRRSTATPVKQPQ